MGEFGFTPELALTIRIRTISLDRDRWVVRGRRALCDRRPELREQ
jgi:hypothetical protein